MYRCVGAWLALDCGDCLLDIVRLANFGGFCCTLFKFDVTTDLLIEIAHDVKGVSDLS